MNRTRSLAVAIIAYLTWRSDLASGRPTTDQYLTFTHTASDVADIHTRATGLEEVDDPDDEEFETYEYADNDDLYDEDSSFDMSLDLEHSESAGNVDKKHDGSHASNSKDLDATENPIVIDQSPESNAQANEDVDPDLAAVKRNSAAFSGISNAPPELAGSSAGSSETGDRNLREGSSISGSSNGASSVVDVEELAGVNSADGEAFPEQREFTATEAPNCHTAGTNNRDNINTDTPDEMVGSPRLKEASTPNQLQPCGRTDQAGAIPKRMESNAAANTVSNRGESGLLPHHITGSDSHRAGLGHLVVIDGAELVDLDGTGSRPVASDTEGDLESSIQPLGNANNTSLAISHSDNFEGVDDNVRISEGGSNSSRSTGPDVHLVINDNDHVDAVFPGGRENNQKAGELPDVTGQQEANNVPNATSSDKSNTSGASYLHSEPAINPTRSLQHLALSTPLSVITSSAIDHEPFESDVFTHPLKLTELFLAPSTSSKILQTDVTLESIIRWKIPGNFPSQVLVESSIYFTTSTAYETSLDTAPDDDNDETLVSQISPSEVILDNAMAQTSTILQYSVPWFLASTEQIRTPSLTTSLHEPRSAPSTQPNLQETTQVIHETAAANESGSQSLDDVINTVRTLLPIYNPATPSLCQSTDVTVLDAEIMNRLSDSSSSNLFLPSSLSTSTTRISYTAAVIPTATATMATTDAEIVDYNNSKIYNPTPSLNTGLTPLAPETVASATTPDGEATTPASNHNDSHSGTPTTSTQPTQNVGLYDSMTTTHSLGDLTSSSDADRNISDLETSTWDAVAKPGSHHWKPGNLTSTSASALEWPSSFMELKFGMSWPDFCQNEMSIRGDLVAILQGRDQRMEVSVDQIQLMNREREECYKVQLLETEEISVRMYLMNKAHHFDRSLTLVCANILVSGLSGGDSSATRNKLLAVRVHDEDGLELATGASTKREENDHNDPSMFSDPGVTIAIALASIGGSYCLGLVVLQIFLRQRNRGLFMPGLSRSYSATSSDSIHLSSVNKSRPNSGLFNPGLDKIEPLEPSNPLNYFQLSKFSMDDSNIYEEYQKIPHRMPRLSVVPPGDEDKNRYANVLPLAHTRVKLHHDGFEPRSNYINANYVTGPRNQPQYYIATQAPTETTTGDFWSMVWHEGCKAVVMLTQLEEEGQVKCANYFPELVGRSAAQRHGDFLIELKQKDVHQEYITSKLVINNLREIETQEIDHFWYTCWPPVGVPEPISLVKLVLDTRPKYEVSQAPLVVHCSPGTGRTCTFIALDLCMRQFEERRTVDVVKTVYGIRQERAGAIQNKEQYSLLYNAISEYASTVISPIISAASSATTLHALLPS